MKIVFNFIVAFLVLILIQVPSSALSTKGSVSNEMILTHSIDEPTANVEILLVDSDDDYWNCKDRCANRNISCFNSAQSAYQSCVSRTLVPDLYCDYALNQATINCEDSRVGCEAGC